MDNSQNSIKAFTDAIKRMAAEECQTINNETKQIKAQRLEDLRKQSKAKYDEYINYELSRIQAEKNKRISILHENEKKELAELRSQLTEKIFNTVVEDILHFTHTNDYKNLLIRSAKEIIEALPDEELEFFVRSEDMALCDEICKNVGKTLKISPAEDIKLGGIKAVGLKTESLADNTLDMKLEQQKAWFVENSGFKM